MTPLRYRGIVVGMKQYKEELEKEFERVRRKGRQNRKNVADKRRSHGPAFGTTTSRQE